MTSKYPSNTVYTYGVFDLFHVGHLNLLRQARALGGYLVVGVFTDEAAEKFKRKPVIPFDQRCEILRDLYDVNEVIPQDTYEPDENIKLIEPAVLAKGPGAGWGQEVDKQPGQDTIEALGGRVAILDYMEGQSTSAIITKIKTL